MQDRDIAEYFLPDNINVLVSIVTERVKVSYIPFLRIYNLKRDIAYLIVSHDVAVI